MTSHQRDTSFGSPFGLPIGSPLFKSVKHQILSSLETGEWKPGEAIPSEKKLAEQMGVSIGTLRKAIEELVDEEVLIRHQGRGTFVSAHDVRDYSKVFFRLQPRQQASDTGVHQDVKKALVYQADLAGWQTRAGQPAEIQALGLEPGCALIQIDILHRFDGLPAAFDQITIPAGHFPELDAASVRHYRCNTYQLLQDRYASSVLRVRDVLSSHPAPAHVVAMLQGLGETSHLPESQNLHGNQAFFATHTTPLSSTSDCPQASSLLCVHRVAWSYDEAPVEYRVTWINPELVQYVVESRD